MTDMKNSLPSDHKKNKFLPKLKKFLFVLEITIIVALLVMWFSSESIQKSKSLWVLFLYCFPSEFLIAIVPHEPILLYFGKFYPPLTIALVTIAGTLLTETLNYSAFKFVTDMNFFQKIRHRKTVAKIVRLFNKVPFFALLVAGFTPVPFYPFRFLVVMARYPLTKYLLAVFLSRTPRFFLIALIGYTIKFSDYLLVVLFAVLVSSANIPFLIKYLKKKKKNKSNLL